MDRKDFIRTCFALSAFNGLLASCAGLKSVQASADQGKLMVARSEFTDPRKNRMREAVLVRTPGAAYPIVVYCRDNKFTALLLRCTHQGAELSVNGNIITCAAHGSEFTDRGKVLSGPAEQELQSFPVTTDDTHIIIHTA